MFEGDYTKRNKKTDSFIIMIILYYVCDLQNPTHSLIQSIENFKD